MGGHGYSSLLVCYPRPFVCLSVCGENLYSPGCHSAAFAAFTQQYLALNSGRFKFKSEQKLNFPVGSC